jgi:hypothetical protein
MVRHRICEKWSEALALQRGMEYLRAKAMGARKSTGRTGERSNFQVAPISNRTALAERQFAAAARFRHRNDARLRRSQASIEVASLEGNSLRSHEFRWLVAHRHEYPGLWLALDGDVLVASNKSLVEVLCQARHKGSPNPLVALSDEIEEAPFGGW